MVICRENRTQSASEHQFLGRFGLSCTDCTPDGSHAKLIATNLGRYDDKRKGNELTIRAPNGKLKFRISRFVVTLQELRRTIWMTAWMMINLRYSSLPNKDERSRNFAGYAEGWQTHLFA